MVSQQDIDDADNLGDFLETHYGTPTTVYKTVKANLPTVMHMDADWNMYKKFYLNLNGNLSLVDKSALGKTSSANTCDFDTTIRNKMVYILTSYKLYGI